MLKLLTRKICPFMTLAIATVGCGKKITENSSQAANSTQNQELPTSYVLQLNSLEGYQKLYQMPQNGYFEVPTQLRVRKGDALNKSVEVRYQANPDNSDDFQFKCSYKGTGTTEMVLVKCVDYDEADLGNLTNQLFGLYKGDYIEMRFTGTSVGDITVESIHNMSWK